MPLTDELKEALAARFAKELERDKASAQPVEPERRIVVDTNVLLDLLYWHDPKCQGLLNALSYRSLVPVLDLATLMEAGEVFSRDRFSLSEAEVLSRLDVWLEAALPISQTEVEAARERLRVHCPDELDQKFLELAVASGARWLVSKDKILLKSAKRLKKEGLTAFRPDAADAPYAQDAA